MNINSANNDDTSAPEKPYQGRSGQPPPSSTLNLYRRLPFGRKHFFGHENPDRAAEFFVVNPVPQKHHNSWRPVFYRGDNPKYSGLSTPVGRALRTKMWNRFHIQIGDGMAEVLQNKERAKKRKKYERKQKLRKFFCQGEKPPPEPLEDPQEVRGLVAIFEMKRSGFLGRALEWDLGGQRYQWKGTRRFQTGPFWGLKGVSHDFKLVDADNNIVATFEKDRWASCKRSEKLGRPPNKKRLFLGTLQRYYPAADAPPPAAVLEAVRSAGPDAAYGLPEKLTKHLNLQGSHSGDLTEEAIAFTCWIAVEAEHRLRYKIFDLIEEVLENIGSA
ncbi:hypothetical protein L209DRAFT_688301 [Thermothelomyces heterothallicus CBS 203.75]